MTNEQRDIQRKLRVLQHAEKIGNARKACRYFGVGRSSFYRWRDTRLALTVSGYDAKSGKIEDMDGALSLITRDDQIAASWSFRGMMAHWNRKSGQTLVLSCSFDSVLWAERIADAK